MKISSRRCIDVVGFDVHIGLSFSGVSFNRQSVFFQDPVCVAQISDAV